MELFSFLYKREKENDVMGEYNYLPRMRFYDETLRNIRAPIVVQR